MFVRLSCLLDMLTAQPIFTYMHSSVEVGFADYECTPVLFFAVIVLLRRQIPNVSDITLFYVLFLFDLYLQGYRVVICL